jgi:hypothetical protein
VTFFILFALEANIIATSVHAMYSGIPRWAVLVVVGIFVLALNWHGVSSLGVAMAITLPVFLILIGSFIARSATLPPAAPVESPEPTVTAVLAVGGALMAFIVNATVAADVGRFLGPQGRAVAVPLLGIGLQVLSFIGSVFLGAWMYTRLGLTDPGKAFVLALGAWGVLAVVASQVRINMINLYAGSLSLSNFGRRAFGWQPGRANWSLVLAIGGTALALANIYEHLLVVLTFQAVFTCAWVGVLVSSISQRNLSELNVGDVASVKSFDLVGLGALAIALLVSIPPAFGVFGAVGKGLAPFMALVTAAICTIVLDSRIARAQPDRAEVQPPADSR